MQKLRRWAAAALCGAAFAGSAAAVLAACAVCPGRAWIVRVALFLQDPAAAAVIAWPADAARAALLPNTFLQALVYRVLTGPVLPEVIEK